MVANGGLVAFPTDACYVLACQLDDKEAVGRLRAVRAIDERHLLTLMCRDLSDIGLYAKVDNRQYRLLKNATPGPYTFILEATKEVPRRLSHPSRKTIGLRVPDHRALQELRRLDEAIASCAGAGFARALLATERLLLMLRYMPRYWTNLWHAMRAHVQGRVDCNRYHSASLQPADFAR